MMGAPGNTSTSTKFVIVPNAALKVFQLRLLSHKSIVSPTSDVSRSRATASLPDL